MHPQEQFCHNLDCPAKGQSGKGNIRIHSRKEKRYRCDECGRTFTERKGTALEGLKKESALFGIVIALLAHGCPIPAIVAAYGLDVRTVRSWLQKAGLQCEKVHHHFLGTKLLDLLHVQADELKIRIQGGWCWLASAMMVSTRLWLGGAVSKSRNRALLLKMLRPIKAAALCRPLLLAVDGLPAYIGAFRLVFRSPLPRRGKSGRKKYVAWPDITIVQVVKKISAEAFDIERRIVQGTLESCTSLLEVSKGGQVINTAFIERLNATFRQRLGVLVRRSRHAARKLATLETSMFLLGCVYNFCTFHKSLRLPLYIGERNKKWVKRTPAIAAGWTDHPWTILELLTFKVPPERWKPPSRRGRHSNHTRLLIQKWCS